MKQDCQPGWTNTVKPMNLLAKANTVADRSSIPRDFLLAIDKLAPMIAAMYDQEDTNEPEVAFYKVFEKVSSLHETS